MLGTQFSNFFVVQCEAEIVAQRVSRWSPPRLHCLVTTTAPTIIDTVRPLSNQTCFTDTVYKPV